MQLPVGASGAVLVNRRYFDDLRRWRRIQAASYNSSPELKRLIEYRVLLAEEWAHRHPCDRSTAVHGDARFRRYWDGAYDEKVRDLENEIIALRVSLDEEAPA